MGKTIMVTSFEDMAKAARKLETVSQTYTDIYKRLLGCADTMGSAWEGADNIAFVNQIKGCTDRLKMMAAMLSTAGQVIDKQRENLKARQESNIVQAKKLSN